jgi:hypothetical protein
MRYLLLFSLVILFSCKNNNPASQNQARTETVSKEEQKQKEKEMEGAIRDSTDIANEKAKIEKQNGGKTASDSLYRLVILFASPGSGAEYLLMNEYIDSVGVYGESLGKKIEYKRVAWGREGESDIVMQLKELSPAQQADFLVMTRRVLSKGKYVNIYENYPYRVKGK